MKNLFFALVSVLLLSHAGFSQILEEHFDYLPGDSIGAHGWVSNSGGSTNRIVVISPGLEFSGDPSTNIGNATKLANTGQDEYRPFSVIQNSGTVYAYFMVRVDTAKSGDYFAAMLPSTSAASYSCRAYVKDSLGNLAFGITKTTEAVTYTPTIYSRGVVYYLVLKYEFVPGTLNDKVSLFVFTNFIPSVEPTPTIGPLAPVTGADATDLGRFGLRQGTASSSPTLSIDGISVNTSWNTVLPVELASFTSIVSDRDVSLYWTTFSETNNSGFVIERSNGVANEWNSIGFIKGCGTINSEVNYSFKDHDLNSGLYRYRLKQTDYNGSFVYLNLQEDVVIGIPVKHQLVQNFPNPFNPETKIRYMISQTGNVRVSIYDLTGNEIAVLVNEPKVPGYHSIDFNASTLSSGIYFCKLTAGKYSDIIRMTLIK